MKQSFSIVIHNRPLPRQKGYVKHPCLLCGETITINTYSNHIMCRTVHQECMKARKLGIRKCRGRMNDYVQYKYTVKCKTVYRY